MHRLILAMCFVLVPCCAFRTPGIEVALRIEPAESSPESSLFIERIELLPCPDAPMSAEWTVPSLVSTAHAHELPGIGPLTIQLPSSALEELMPQPPGIYCDVRVQFGDRTRPALAMHGTAEAPFTRATVLRLVDATGAPTELALATAPTHAAIHVRLGAFDGDSDPPRALTRIIRGASAEVVAN